MFGATLIDYPKTVGASKPMPIPKPNKGEKQADYMARVMPMLSKEFTDNKQAVAVALSTFRRGGKKAKRKVRRKRLMKSHASESAKLVRAGIGMISGAGSQGDVYWDRRAQTARVVYRPSRNVEQEGEWLAKVSDVLGIARSRISTHPQAPKEYGQGSTWVRITPAGEVLIDPALEVEDPVTLEDKGAARTSFFYDKANERKFAAQIDAKQREAMKPYVKQASVALDTLHATQEAVIPDKVEKFVGANDRGKAFIIRQNGTDYIADGHHRLEAHRLEGKTHADVDLVLFDEEGPMTFREEKPLAYTAGGTPVIPRHPAGLPVTERKAARMEIACPERICKIAENGKALFVLGPLMFPDQFDNQGDVAPAEVIERAAHAFVEDSQQGGAMHKIRLKKRDATLVESYIVRSKNYVIDGVLVPEGTWMVGWNVYSPDLQNAIKRGHFKGFSIGANAMCEEID